MEHNAQDDFPVETAVLRHPAAAPSAIAAVNVKITIGASQTLRNSAQNASGEDSARTATPDQNNRAFTNFLSDHNQSATGATMARSRNGQAKG